MICPNCSNTKVQEQWIDIKIKQDFEDELRQKRKLKKLEIEAKKAGYYGTIDYVNAKRKAINDNYKNVQEKKERKQKKPIQTNRRTSPISSRLAPTCSKILNITMKGIYD